MCNAKMKLGRYVIGAILGLMMGVALYFIQPVQWKGQALVRVGQIAQNQNQNQNQNSYSIEPLTTVVERIRSRSFVQGVAERAKKKEIMALLNVDEEARMTIKPTRNSDSLVINVVGGSSELVRVSMEAIVAELVAKHNAILNVYQADIVKELSRLDSEINDLTKRIVVVNEAIAVKPSEGKAVAAGLSLMMSQRDLEYKLNRSSLLREAISSANIRSTTLLEPISISERRIFSSLWRACLFGVLSGIFLSAIWVRWGK